MKVESQKTDANNSRQDVLDCWNAFTMFTGRRLDSAKKTTMR